MKETFVVKTVTRNTQRWILDSKRMVWTEYIIEAEHFTEDEAKNILTKITEPGVYQIEKIYMEGKRFGENRYEV